MVQLSSMNDRAPGDIRHPKRQVLSLMLAVCKGWCVRCTVGSRISPAATHDRLDGCHTSWADAHKASNTVKHGRQ